MAATKRWWNEGSSSEFDYEAKVPYERTGSEWIGKRTLRSFGKSGQAYGVIESWLPGGGEAASLYRNRHDDGDDEELDEAQVKEAVDNATETPGPPPPCSVEDNEDVEEAAPVLPEGSEAWLSAAFEGVEYMCALSADEVSVGRPLTADLIATLQVVAQTAPAGPLRAIALFHAERLAQRWKSQVSSLDDNVDAGQVTDAMLGLDVLERLGVSHAQLKHECREFASRLVASRGEGIASTLLLGLDYTAEGDIFGAVEAQQLKRFYCVAKNRYRALTSALLSTYHATRLGLFLGAGDAEVLGKLQYLRPYKPLQELGWEVYLDQLTLAVCVVDCCSDFGELKLQAGLEQERDLLLHPNTLQLALKRKDSHLLGQLSRAARIFGEDGHETVKAATEFFLASKRRTALLPSELWPTRGDDVHPYTRFHAASCAVKALYPLNFRGFGPATAAQQELFSCSRKIAACGAKLTNSEVMRKIAEKYATGHAEDSVALARFTFQETAVRRLCGLLKWKAADSRKSIDDYAADAAKAKRQRRLR